MLLRLFAVLGILTFALLAQADVTDPTRDHPLADPAMEAQARAFMRDIRCVVCQSQSIDESDAEIAAQLRNAIREQMAAGKSPDEIRDFLVARYGDFVLLKPPFKASTLLLWAGPFILVAIGLGFILLQRRQKSAGAAGNAGLTPPELSESERNRVQRLLRGEDTP
jgi:cytochrome c-type biogenesis protein CcmH